LFSGGRARQQSTANSRRTWKVEVAVIKEGEDKYCNHPLVIIADDLTTLESKIGKFLLDQLDDDDIGRIMKAQNAENEPDEESYADEEAYEKAYEAWKNYKPNTEAIAKFHETGDVSGLRELHQEHVCCDLNPWDQWQIHTTGDDDAYSSVTVLND
jgi:hypothetical protein